ncbi:hypothetical protein BC829DRAFT_202296 [Chytridium lagenaria]|nr:hypothetical protein BC829DRAFT_202296 [Chytridium lagenaria]
MTSRAYVDVASDDASLGQGPRVLEGWWVPTLAKYQSLIDVESSDVIDGSVAPHAEGVRRRKNGAKQIDSFGESSPGKKGDSVKFEVADRKMMGKIDMIRYKIVEPQSDLVLTHMPLLAIFVSDL